MIVFENEQILVKKTGRDYDFIATIENKTDKEIFIVFADEELEPIAIDDWVGICADCNGFETLVALEASAFQVLSHV